MNSNKYLTRKDAETFDFGYDDNALLYPTSMRSAWRCQVKDLVRVHPSMQILADDFGADTNVFLVPQYPCGYNIVIEGHLDKDIGTLSSSDLEEVMS